MTIREEVDALLSQITASKLETLRLERQLRVVQAVCPHENLEPTSSEDLYLSNKTVEYRCRDCDKVVRTERIQFNR